MGNYQSARFNWKAIQRSHQDKVRCIASNATSAGISNYAQLIVKTQPIPIRAPEAKGDTQFLLVLKFIASFVIFATFCSFSEFFCFFASPQTLEYFISEMSIPIKSRNCGRHFSPGSTQYKKDKLDF